MSIEDKIILACSGGADAQSALADCYYYGREGCPQSYADAARWYERAAKQGHAYAMYSLGYCYQNGQGVPKGDATALMWYRESAKLGNGAAMCSIGEYYEKGVIVNQNIDIATDWYVKAFEAGNGRACGKIADFYYEGKCGCYIDYKKAAYFFSAGAERGNAYCMYSLGYCCQYGKGVVKDTQQAVYWYGKAAEKGNSSAKEALRKLGY